MIEARGVHKHYGDKTALDGVSFSISRGEVVGFLGLNGAGKTTMLTILCGLLLPTAGSVVVDGIDAVSDPLALRRQIGLPHQQLLGLASPNAPSVKRGAGQRRKRGGRDLVPTALKSL